MKSILVDMEKLNRRGERTILRNACVLRDTATRQKMHEVKPATKDPHVHRVVNVYNDPNQLTQCTSYRR